MYRNAAAIGADIGREEIRVATVKMDGSVAKRDSFPLPVKQSRDRILSVLQEALRTARFKAAESGINTISVGIAARGFVNHEDGVILGPGHGIKGWKDVPVGRIISRDSGLPVFVGNDANLMTLAEQRYGTAKGYGNVIFIALRTGIGGGIIINGQLYRGVNNAGGEIGQMIINYNGPKSDTGIPGSFEYFASGLALSRRFAETTKRSSHLIPAKEIIRMAGSGDEAAKTVLKENAQLVGVGVASLISIFAPEIIVLGGTLASAGKTYLAEVRKSAVKNSLPNCRPGVKIEYAGLGQDASLIGAGYYSLVRLAGKQI